MKSDLVKEIEKLGSNPLGIKKGSEICLEILESFNERDMSSTQRKNLTKTLKLIKPFISRTEARYKHNDRMSEKPKEYYDLVIKIATLQEEGKNFNDATESANIILSDLVSKEKSMQKTFGEQFKEGYYDTCIKAMYIKALNKLRKMIFKGEDITEQSEKIKEIERNDINGVIDKRFVYDAIISGFDSAVDMIRVEEDENKTSEEKFRELLNQESVEELSRYIFPIELMNNNSNGDRIIIDKKKSSIPEELSALRRLQYIKDNFGITNIQIGKSKGKLGKGKNGIEIEGTYIIETENPDIVIVESFYERKKSGIKETDGKATYVLTKEFADRLLDSGSKRREARKEAKKQNELFRPVNHQKKNPQRYYENLYKTYTEIRDGFRSKLITKIYRELILAERGTIKEYDERLIDLATQKVDETLEKRKVEAKKIADIRKKNKVSNGSINMTNQDPSDDTENR